MGKKSLPAGLARAVLFCAPGAAAVALLCGVTAAALEDRPKVLVSYDVKERPANLGVVSLRPNVTQAIYLHVQNTGADKRTLSVKLLHTADRPGAAPVTVATADLGEVGAGATKLVSGWKLTPPAPPTITPVAAPGAAPAPAAPPGFEVGRPPFRLQVQVFTGKEPKPAGEPAAFSLRVMEPLEYVKVSEISFKSDESGKENVLRVRVQALEGFTGPQCPVSLDLRPALIPGLRPEQTSGTYKQFLTRNGEVLLGAENLKFRAAPPRSGLVYLSADGYERAFIYETTFAGLGRTVTPVPVTKPQMRLVAERYSLPADRFTVGVEVDNPPSPDALLRVGLDRDKDGVVSGTEFEERHGSRRQSVRVLPPGPDGELLLQTEVKPWAVEVNSAGLAGTFLMQGRLGDGDGAVKAEGRVTFDGTRPENVKFLADGTPRELRVGDPVVLKATGDDPESGIAQVVFFAGKPAAGGKVPPGAVTVKADPPAVKGAAWTAKLPLPAGAKGTTDVSVQFTNGAGLTAVETIPIQLVPPPPPPKPSVEGTVYVGDLAQPSLTVYLRDPQGVEKDKTTTDAAGKYVFKDVPPGTYRVTASKAAGSKGSTAVTVTDGKKTGVDVKMTR